MTTLTPLQASIIDAHIGGCKPIDIAIAANVGVGVIDSVIRNNEAAIDKRREELIDAVKAKYEERIKALLENISKCCEKDGMVVGGVSEMHDDEYMWCLTVWRNAEDRGAGTCGHWSGGYLVSAAHPADCKCGAPRVGFNYDKSVDIMFEISESRSYDDEMIDGINFGIQITENGGAMLGGLQPFNYTDQCWVHASDATAVEERFGVMEAADVDNIPNLIKD